MELLAQSGYDAVMDSNNVTTSNSSISKENFIHSLNLILPKDSVLHEAEDTRAFECDGLSAYRKLPWVVALPDTVEQMQAIVRICAAHQVPIIARGAGTGLSGGALPEKGCLLLSLTKLNKILEIDVNNNIARVQPGVRNLAISDAAKQYGLYYAPDPSSQIACSIGGNVAENSGGVHCLKYGLTVNNIQKITILTIDGELVTLGTDGYDNPGYDLLALMNGSEGMLGIVVEVTVKLLPIPEYAQVLLAVFDNVEHAGDAVAAIISEGIIPAGLEMMDNLAIRAAEDYAHVGYPTEAAAILLCELDGNQAEVNQQIQKVSTLMKSHQATNIRVSESEQQRLEFWLGRKSAFPAVGRMAPDYYCMDGTIPRSQLSYVLSRIKELSEQYNLPVANVFHAGDGNLHPLILYDANIKGELKRTEEFGAKILELCVEVGGSITGEHGVGVEKINQMCIQFSQFELHQFHKIKDAFDPNRLLNPGKAVPTLHRCAELGAMHVHNGKLPHPELDRF